MSRTEDIQYLLGKRLNLLFGEEGWCSFHVFSHNGAFLGKKKHIFQCGQCKMQTLDCTPGVIMQTESKTPTEVLLYVSSKQTNLIKATRSASAPWFSSRVRLNITRISWEGSRGFGWFI